jgi:GTP-binding protein
LKPVIALVGRPNVGKSTLFNRLTKTRDAIVADFAGLTRDRHYGDGHHGRFEYIVVDTGGFEPVSGEGVVREMAKQTRLAIDEADVVLFVVDARAGCTGQDHDIAAFLRPLGKAVMLVANKAEGMTDGSRTAEFFELGLGEPVAVSAAHGQGIRTLVERALQTAGCAPGQDGSEVEEGSEVSSEDVPTLRLAVAGRPNVGKSTLINAWLGEERLVSFDMPGTTRDAIHVPLERDGRKFELIDTAGLRRRGRVFEAVEKFSVVKTLQAISQANVVLLLLDATQGVTDQDAHIAGYIMESGRALVVAVNKWDAVDAYTRELTLRAMEQRLPFLKFASWHQVSARKRQGLAPVWKSLLGAHAAAFRKLSTPKLTRVLADAVTHQAPARAGAGIRPKLRYAHQGGQNPPVIVIHGNALQHVSGSYQRYLEGRFRQAFDLTGTPLRIEFKSSRNPFSE